MLFALRAIFDLANSDACDCRKCMLDQATLAHKPVDSWLCPAACFTLAVCPPCTHCKGSTEQAPESNPTKLRVAIGSDGLCSIYAIAGLCMHTAQRMCYESVTPGRPYTCCTQGLRPPLLQRPKLQQCKAHPLSGALHLPLQQLSLRIPVGGAHGGACSQEPLWMYYLHGR